MTFIWCCENTPIARCSYEGTGAIIEFKEYVPIDLLADRLQHMIPYPIDSGTLYRALSKRVMPKERFTIEIAKKYGTPIYNPEVMCRITHGAKPADTFWMRYEDDPPSLCFADVDVQ